MANNQRYFLLRKESELAKNPELASIIHELTYLAELDYECKAYIEKLIQLAESVVCYLITHSTLTDDWESFFTTLLLRKMHEDTRKYHNASLKSLVEIIWFLEKRVHFLTALEGGIVYFKHVNKNK